MFKMRLLLLAAVLAVAGLAHAERAAANQFTFDEKVNQEVAKQLDIPVYFAVPDSAKTPLPEDIDTTDKLIDFRHPDAIKANAKVGLRLVIAKRSGLARRLAKSGLVKTGDLLLTFRAEWGGAGAYPNVQMGISHTGVAYVKDGLVYNIDNPLNAEYVGARPNLTSHHYRTLDLLHIIRPRNLTEAQRANLVAWATRLHSRSGRIYQRSISFNQDYNDPKYEPGKPLDFVQHLGRAALGFDPPGNVGMFCSEFAWSLLALRNCDPASSAEAFKGEEVPACVTQVMKPMQATGNYVTSRSSGSYTGLADGPLVIIDTLKLPKPDREKLVESLFVTDPEGLKRMSVGHRTVAKEMQPKFEKLKSYYLSAINDSWLGMKARMMSLYIRRGIPENYSPTSFLINTLLAPDNENRTMDYVATVYLK